MSYRQLHFICLDGDNHQVVQILRTRYKKTLLKYFGRFSPQARANVQVSLETGNIQELKSLINSKDSIGTLMHKTLFTFKHNLKAVLNGEQLCLILTAALKGSTARSNKLNVLLMAILILLIS